MRSRATAALLMVAAALTLALSLSGCGGLAATAATALTPVATPGTGAVGVHSSPAQIMAASAAAFDRLSSFQMAVNGLDARGQPWYSTMMVGLPGRMELINAEANVSDEVRVIGPKAYMRGNIAYWVDLGYTASQVSVLTNRWIELPTSSKLMLRYRVLTQRSTVGHCMMQSGFGSLSVSPKLTKVGGTPALELTDNGSLPGGGPSRLYISAGYPALPLIEDETGPKTPGETVDRKCGVTYEADGVSSEHVAFSRYNAPVTVRTPGGATPIATLKIDLNRAAPKSVDSTGSQRAAERAQAQEMLGTWAVSGRTVESYHSTGATVGATYQRVWVIQRRCELRGCPLWIVRTTNAGRMAAQLTWSGGHWSATFVSTNYCNHGGQVPEYDSWTFVVSPGWIEARSVNRVLHCGNVHDTEVWTARQTAKPASTTARS